jgi:phosphate transport system permease protein
MTGINRQTFAQKWRTYKKHPFSLFLLILVILAAALTVFILVSIVGYILVKGIPHLKPSLFALEYTSDNVSMLPAMINTLTVTLVSLLISVPLGVFSAVYLIEYARRGNRLVKVIRLTTETLAGIPSIVYGLFGMMLFVIASGFGQSLLAGALTLSIMVLPTIMRTTEEAIKAVPDAYREGSFGLGAGRLRTVFRIILPSAMQGILAGVILSIGRIVGETAALIFTAGTAAGVPDSLLGSGRTLSLHMWVLSSEGLHVNEAYATAVVLLVIVAAVNALSAAIAKKISRRGI